MTTNRNIPEDIANTKLMLKNKPKAPEEESWLGHKKGAGKIDWMLLEGATMQRLLSARGGVEQHFYHLKNQHGLTVVNEGGVYRFKP